MLRPRVERVRAGEVVEGEPHDLAVVPVAAAVGVGHQVEPIDLERAVGLEPHPVNLPAVPVRIAPVLAVAVRAAVEAARVHGVVADEDLVRTAADDDADPLRRGHPPALLAGAALVHRDGPVVTVVSAVWPMCRPSRSSRRRKVVSPGRRR